MKKLVPYFLIFLLHNVASSNLIGMDVDEADKSEKPWKPQARALTNEQIRDYFQQGLRVYRAIINKELPPQLYNTAYRCFVQAAAFDHPVALFNAGLFNEYGLGTEKDLETAASFYRKARECGYKDRDKITLSLKRVKAKIESNLL